MAFVIKSRVNLPNQIVEIVQIDHFQQNIVDVRNVCFAKCHDMNAF